MIEPLMQAASKSGGVGRRKGFNAEHNRHNEGSKQDAHQCLAHHVVRTQINLVFTQIWPWNKGKSISRSSLITVSV
jgi:hypothetical protein